MAGIPVHTSSPINRNSTSTTAAKPSTTTAEPPTLTNPPASFPATTTTANPNSGYPPARPGASAIPGPTSVATATPPMTTAPARTNPPSVTRTTHLDSPAPPQPGQVPSPYMPPPNTATSSIPPPPKAGQLPTPSLTMPAPSGAPALPPVQTSSGINYAVPSQPSTSFYNTATADLSHPPGYSQNVHGSFDDRMAAENSSNASRQGGVGILDNDPSKYPGDGDRLDDGQESMWDTAAKWAKVAGQKLSEGEQQIWKMVDKATGEK